MKKLIIFFIICLIVSIPNLGVCENWTGNINVQFGVKELDEEDWEPIDSQIEFGILLDFRQEAWPVNIAIDILRSKDDAKEFDTGLGFDIDIEGSTLELDLGLRKIWDDSPTTLRPFIGGGVAYINAEFEGSALGISVSDDDSAIGFWIDAGVYWTITTSFNIGFDFRWSTADVTLFDEKGDAGGMHYGLMVGYHW